MSEKRLKFTLESDRTYIGIFNEGSALTGFEVCIWLNSLYQQCEALQDENEQLKEELQRFKKYVFSQDNILCYKCEHCIKKDIYVVDCEMKGEVDVHGLCGWFREVKV